MIPMFWAPDAVPRIGDEPPPLLLGVLKVLDRVEDVLVDDAGGSRLDPFDLVVHPRSFRQAPVGVRTAVRHEPAGKGLAFDALLPV